MMREFKVGGLEVKLPMGNDKGGKQTIDEVILRHLVHDLGEAGLYDLHWATDDTLIGFKILTTADQLAKILTWAKSHERWTLGERADYEERALGSIAVPTSIWGPDGPGL